MSLHGRFEPTRRADLSPQSGPPGSRPSRSFWARRSRLLMAGNCSRPQWLGARSRLDIQNLLRAGSLYPTHDASSEPRQCDSAKSRRPSGALHVKAVQACRPARAEARSQRRRSRGKGRCSPWARQTWAGPRQQVPREEVRSPTQPSIRPARRLRPQNQYLAILLGCRETAIGHQRSLAKGCFLALRCAGNRSPGRGYKRRASYRPRQPSLGPAQPSNRMAF